MITNRQPVRRAGGALLGDARALVTGAQQLAGDSGHGKLPGGGHESCPLAAMRTAR